MMSYFFNSICKKTWLFNLPTGDRSKGSLLLAVLIMSFYWLAGRRRGFIAPLYLPVGERNYYVQWCVLQRQRTGSQKRISAVLNISPLKWKWTPLLYLAVFCWKGFPSMSEVVCTTWLTTGAELWFKIFNVSIFIHSTLVFSLIRDGLIFSDISGAPYSQWCKRNQHATLGFSFASPSDLILHPNSSTASVE